jgi:large subunit ribosomal protein L32
MAVPKKRTSKSKTDKRKAVWKRKAYFAAQKALALGKSILTGRNTGFIYPMADSDESE